MEQLASLADKVVLITGAAGAIGCAVARRLHGEGARIIAVDIAEDRLAAVADDMPWITAIAADVSTPEGADAVLSTAGEVDILVNNAGISDGGGALDELDDDTWNRVVQVNLSAAFLMSRRVIRQMLAKGDGVILNMSSVAGLRGGRTGIAYTASKWALIGFTQNVAASFGNEGIRSYAVCPAGVTGAIGLTAVQPTSRALRNRTRDTQRPDATSPEDVAELVSFLVSPKARHINGVSVPLDRGWLAY